MKVLIFGGTGFVGRNLTEDLLSKGYQVYVVTRNRLEVPKVLGEKVQIIEWDNKGSLSFVSKLEEIDAIVNLAGESIGNRRWSSGVKQEILESRIKTTRAIVTAINEGIIRPKVLISASAVGYYGPHKDEEIIEGQDAGQDFLAEVCRAWENEAYRVKRAKTRVITLRIGVVLGKEGALSRMVTPFRLFFGGPLGTGDQWLSWIHVQDLVRIIRFLIEHEELTGPVNGTAPEQTQMRDFSKELGYVLNRPSWLSVPEFLLKIVLGQMADMIVYGQRVVPKKVVDAGFEFRYPNLKSALVDSLCATKQ